MTQELPAVPSQPDPREQSAAGKAAPGAELGRTAAASPSLKGSIFRLAVGRGAAMTVGILAAPILARLYDPQSFGPYELLLTAVGILAACDSFCYVMATPLAESLSERRALFVLSSMIGGAGTVFLAVVALLGGGWIAKTYGAPDLAEYAVFVPLLFLATAVTALITMALNCEKRFGAAAAYNVVTRALTVAVQIGAAFLGLAKSSFGLMLGAFSGPLLGVPIFFRAVTKSMACHAEGAFHLGDLRLVAVKHKKFPLIQFWSKLFNTLTVGLPVLVMGLLFPVEVVGLYGVARRLVVMPLQLFAASAGQVFYIETAQSSTRGDSVASPTSEVFRLLVVLTAFPLSMVFLAGPLLFEVVLGEPWREAGVYAQILTPWIALIAVGSPLSGMLLVKDRLGENFLYNVVLLAVRVSGITIGGLLVGPKTAIAMFVVGSVFVWGHLVARTLKLAGVSRRQAARVLATSYGEATLLLAPAGVLYWWFNSKMGALAALAVASAAYGAILYRRHPGLAATLRRVMLNNKWSGGRQRQA